MTDRNFTPLPAEMVSQIGPEKIPDKITEEKAAEFLGKGPGHGRIPQAIVKEVVAINNAKKAAQQAIVRAEVNKRNLVERNKKGALIKSQKLDVFLEEFLKNGGNATQAALAVGNYSSLSSAASAGHNYLQQAKGLARIYLEKKGYSYGKLLDKAAKKMEDSKTTEWWDRLMKLADYHDFISKDKGPSTAIVNVIQSHKDLTSSYIEGEMEEVEPIEENENKL